MRQTQQPNSVKRLRLFNDVISIAVAAFALYIIILPIVPTLQLKWQQWRDDTGGLVYESRLVEDVASENAGQDESKKTKRAKIPKDNRLVIPLIQLNEEIIEGEAASSVHLGAWRKPYTSTPDQGGNTVIVGHRFTYSDPAVFYHLDKVEKGDKFPVYWEGEEYDYEIFNIEVVDPSRVEVEAPTKEPILTLYTCTPLWTSSERLVIQAKLIAGPEGAVES